MLYSLTDLGEAEELRGVICLYLPSTACALLLSTLRCGCWGSELGPSHLCGYLPAESSLQALSWFLLVRSLLYFSGGVLLSEGLSRVLTIPKATMVLAFIKTSFFH